MEKIICSAVLINNGIAYKGQPVNITEGFVVCGRRHSDCYATIESMHDMYMSVSDVGTNPVAYGYTEAKDMGFLTTKNRFVGRREAMKIAMAAGQLLFPEYHKNKKETDELFILTSEDIFPYDEKEANFI